MAVKIQDESADRLTVSFEGDDLSRLRRAAARANRTVADVVADSIAEAVTGPPDVPASSPARAVGPFGPGCIDLPTFDMGVPLANLNDNVAVRDMLDEERDRELYPWMFEEDEAR